MKILLDESVPVQVRHALQRHEVTIAVELGWRGVSNGELLTRAEANGFELLIVADKNIRHQQNLSDRISILELWTNHRPTLEQHFVLIHRAAEAIAPGKYVALQPDEH